MNQRDQRELMSGFGDGLARAFELAVTPLIFGAIGWFLDRRFGTQPLFLLIAFFAAIVGIGVREWAAYDAAMKVEEQRRIVLRERRSQ